MSIEKLKKAWYNRMPSHETNADTGEDMFWGTLEMVIDDYNELVKESDFISNVSDCSHPRKYREYIGNNMLRCKKCGHEFK